MPRARPDASSGVTGRPLPLCHVFRGLEGLKRVSDTGMTPVVPVDPGWHPCGHAVLRLTAVRWVVSRSGWFWR